MSPIVRIIVLAVAALAAFGAFFMFRSMTPEQVAPSVMPSVELPKPKPKEVPSVNVLIVNRDMRRGEVLTPDVLQWTKWPKKALNEFFVREDMTPDAISKYTGLRVRNALVASEPLLESKLVLKGQRGYLASQLKSGMRAVSIQISPDSASGGFVLPDDRVDVLLTHTIEREFRDGNDEVTKELTSTITIVRNARVLAIDQVFNPEGTAQIGSTATLELNARAAEVVTLGEELGELSVILRSLVDAEIDGEAVVSKQALLTEFFDPYEGPQAEGVLVIRDGVATRLIGGR